ncbi:MAG: DUF4234 domain-containing protein [Lachnospiraceae bacterium]|nr:DUF4234 domain-containing protein [Lachnospiraceae bacterium]
MQIQKRDIVISIVLSFVTCGIYSIYWYYKLVEESDVFTGHQDGQSAGVVVLLHFVTCGIYTFIWMYQCGERIDRRNAAMGLPASNNAIIYLLLALTGFMIVDLALLQNEINKNV